jgi:hypothetical protein
MHWLTGSPGMQKGCAVSAKVTRKLGNGARRFQFATGRTVTVAELGVAAPELAPAEGVVVIGQPVKLIPEGLLFLILKEPVDLGQALQSCPNAPSEYGTPAPVDVLS